MIAIILILLFIIAIMVLLYLFPLVQICGYSMYPTLYDGEYYLSKRLFREKKTECQVGKIYVYKPPYEDREERFVIKRLADIKDGKYYFLGDNSNDSYDSRYYGYVDSSSVVAELMPIRKEV